MQEKIKIKIELTSEHKCDKYHGGGADERVLGSGAAGGAVDDSPGSHKVWADISTKFALRRRDDCQLLRRVLENKIAERRLAEEHAEGELVLLLAAVELLCVDQKIRVSIYLQKLTIINNFRTIYIDFKNFNQVDLCNPFTCVSL